jgi:urease accessory protein
MSRGEEWVFDSYRSSNEIWIEDKRVVKDVMLLESSNKDLINLPARSLKDRLRPYSCYATVFLFGPLVQKSISELRARYDSISQMQRSAPESFIWSLSDLENGSGVVVRAAGKETEEVKNWLRDNLRGLADVVGREAYSKAFV